MTMSTLFSIISVVLGLGLSLTAIAVLTQALFPEWVARSERRVTQKPFRTFLLGLLLGVILVGISSAFLENGSGPIKFFGAVVLTATFGLAFAGTAGVVHWIGSRLPSPADEDRPWKAIIRGWVVLFLASLAPLLGWFFLLPVALLLGLGGAVCGLFRSAPVRESVSESVAETGVMEIPGAAR